ncbi:MAG: ABC transporter ATP-binding protein [Mariprofundaceae bacterium]|nr:ABC transporter ATP-binding protein [Mariprofundaceae bacterium]
MKYIAIEKLSVKIDEYCLLSGIDFRLYAGEMCGLIGPSGAGKSTLIKAILGLQTYQQGRIRLPSRHKPVAYVPQDDHLHAALRVSQALDYTCQLRIPSLSAIQRQAHIQKICHAVGLSERLEHSIAKLSGGQRKRVSVALEMLTKPDVMIFDEPTSGLDPGMDTQLMQLFASIAKQQKIVLVATHTMQNLMLCDQLLIMQQGYMVYFGSPAMALKWFKVTELEEIFLCLHQQTAEQAFYQYQKSGYAKGVAKRVPVLMKEEMLKKPTTLDGQEKEAEKVQGESTTAKDILRKIRSQIKHK